MDPPPPANFAKRVVLAAIHGRSGTANMEDFGASKELATAVVHGSRVEKWLASKAPGPHTRFRGDWWRGSRRYSASQLVRPTRFHILGCSPAGRLFLCYVAHSIAVSTVAILAQGTSRAVASTQAFLFSSALQGCKLHPLNQGHDARINITMPIRNPRFTGGLCYAILAGDASVSYITQEK